MFKSKAMISKVKKKIFSFFCATNPSFFFISKTRRYYKPSSPTIPKKRTTLNSREASIGLEEVLAFKEAIEQSKSKKKKATTTAVTVLQDCGN